jgi:hypothetical protein
MWLDLLLALIAIYIIWRLTDCRTFPSPQFMMLIGFFLYFYLGVILNASDEYFIRETQAENVILITRLGFLGVFAAALITSKWKTLQFSYYQNLYSQPDSSDDNWTKKNIKVLAIMMIFLVILFLLLIPAQPLKIMFTTPSQLGYAREAVTANFKYFGFFSNFFYNIMPLIWIALFLSKKKKFALLLLMLNFVAVLSTGQKSPVVYTLVLYLCTIGFINGKFNYKKTMFFALLSFVFLVAVVFLQNAHLFSGFSFESIESSANGLLRRIFFVGPKTFLNYFDTFPSGHPFLIDQSSSLSAHRIVYENIYGLEIKGTVNSTSLIFFYGWFGNIYLASVLYFMTCLLFFSTPFILSKFHASKYLLAANYIAIYLLMIKFNITDWYTIYFAFTLSFFILHGLTYITRFLFYFRGGAVICRGSYFSVLVSILMCLYFIQGQLKGLLLR